MKDGDMSVGNQSVVILEKASVRYRSPEERFWSFKEYAIRLLERRVKMRDFWALTDVSLEIKLGETFGIIGRNGAGKTTLLKLVSRVLTPTSGRVITYGCVTPLLELGAGFHPELTGRENVFLNGSLLGHSQKEIKAHIPEILGFAQIDGYIDAPLRTYSNGMVARLGFAVATTWVPDILILDEILAVGDEEFRKKCYKRMNEIRDQGTTILFVSHNLKAIQTLCERAVWLEQGRVQSLGFAGEVIQAYKRSIKV